jgi:5-deoxy-glucuronate isomerase
MRTLTTAGDDTAHINLALADLSPGEAIELTDDVEVAAVVMSGVVDAHTTEGLSLGRAGGRADVFEAPGETVYAPSGTGLRIEAIHDAPVQLAIASVAAEPSKDAAPARVIGLSDQRINEVGKGNWSRTVRTILGPEPGQDAQRLLLGETINPPGNWSSYPPHRHDRHNPPEEVDLEEVYLFKTNPVGGFGVQLRYELDGDRAEEAFLVRDDDVAVIRTGFHPVVAASGYELYYLWVMAGDGRVMMPYLDPAHAWVQNGR